MSIFPKLVLFPFLTLLVLIMPALASAATKKQESEEGEKTRSALLSAASRRINQHSLGLGVGQTFLSESFSNFGEDKITADLFYSYSASYSFDLVLNYHNTNHSHRAKNVNLRGFTAGIKGRLYEYDSFSPFFMGGIGFYQPQVENESIRSDLKTTFGVHIGSGADLRLNDKVTIGLLAQVHKPFDVKQEETSTVRGSYFKFLFTTMYHF